MLKPATILSVGSSTAYSRQPHRSTSPRTMAPGNLGSCLREILSSLRTSSPTSSVTTLCPRFYERNWDGTLQTMFITRPLWGVGSTSPYGHEGRSMTLDDV